MRLSPQVILTWCDNLIAMALFLAQCLLNHFALLSYKSFQFSNLFVLFFHLSILCFQEFILFFNLLSHDRLGRRDTAAAAAEFEADAGVNHVFPAAEAATDAEHGIFVRAIVGTDSDCIGAGIVAVTSCEVPLVVRVKIERVEGCQSGCASTDAIDAAIQLVERMAQAVDVFRVGNDGLIRVVELPAIDSVRRAFSNFAIS